MNLRLLLFLTENQSRDFLATLRSRILKFVVIDIQSSETKSVDSWKEEIRIIYSYIKEVLKQYIKDKILTYTKIHFIHFDQTNVVY